MSNHSIHTPSALLGQPDDGDLKQLAIPSLDLGATITSALDDPVVRILCEAYQRGRELRAMGEAQTAGSGSHGVPIATLGVR